MMEELYGLTSSTPPSAFTASDHHHQYYSSPSMAALAMPDSLHLLPDHHHHHHHHHHHQPDYCYYDNRTAFPQPPPAAGFVDRMPGMFSVSSSGVSDAASSAAAGEEVSCAMNAKIASHPLYPKLLQAYIDCQKVGAPPEIATVLDEIRRDSEGLISRTTTSNSGCMDPELDVFMETYCDILMKYKADLAKPFDEAITFLNNMETQLNTLANITPNDYGAGSSDEEDLSGGELELQGSPHTNEDHELKDKLLRKYSGYISSLKHEFSKKKKKGKLPKEARKILFDWWNLHFKWPYPTEEDKITLAQATGLDQKQINNWFINQRKRHWKPSENMQFAVIDTLYGPCFSKED